MKSRHEAIKLSTEISTYFSNMTDVYENIRQIMETLNDSLKEKINFSNTYNYIGPRTRSFFQPINWYQYYYIKEKGDNDELKYNFFSLVFLEYLSSHQKTPKISSIMFSGMQINEEWRPKEWHLNEIFSYGLNKDWLNYEIENKYFSIVHDKNQSKQIWFSKAIYIPIGIFENGDDVRNIGMRIFQTLKNEKVTEEDESIFVAVNELY